MKLAVGVREASEAPGTFTGDFAIGRGNPMSGGRGMGFWFLSGEVEITSIAGRLVSGEVRANAWRNRYHEIDVGYVDDPFGPELTSVVARFTFLANSGLAPRLGIPMARRCLAEGPAPRGSVSTIRQVLRGRAEFRIGTRKER